jgi:hypothetical protein
MFLFFVFFFSFSSGWTFASLAERAIGFDVNDTCAFTRPEALACIVNYIDVNHDGQIDKQEFDRAKRLFLPAQARALSWFMKKTHIFDINFEFAKKQCDADCDGVLSPWDFLNAKTCLINQGELCVFESLCKRAEKIVDQEMSRIQTNLHKKGCK